MEQLNEVLQKYLNPADKKRKEKKSMAEVFREGDKVMQIKNNYKLEWEIQKGITTDGKRRGSI